MGSTSERRFKVRRIGFQIPELTRLPFLFHVVPSGVESVTMRVQMRIGHTVYRTRCEMKELSPNHIARGPVLIRAILSHPCLNL